MTTPNLTDAAFRRLGYRAGIKRFEKSFFDQSRAILDDKLIKIINKAILYTEHQRKRTLDVNSVNLALKSEAINLGWKPETSLESKKRLNVDIYIGRILKQVHPQMGINQQTRNQINKLIVEIIAKYADETYQLLQLTNKKTISALEVQTVTRLIMKGELAKQAVSEGTKAVTKHNTVFVEQEENKQKGIKVTPMTLTDKAGLTMSPARVETILRYYLGGKQRLGLGANVYLAAVLEYLIAEILELAGNITRDTNRVRITNRSLLIAIRNDSELNRLARELDFVVAYGGVIPNIHLSLLPKGTGK